MKLRLLNHAKPVLSFFQKHGDTAQGCEGCFLYETFFGPWTSIHRLVSMDDNDAAKQLQRVLTVPGASIYSYL